ncbi:MAG: enoyl-CoA hydratase/isomerase family protein [Polaromonas sp.]|uniref:enoyl-CoA hydratase/isomerase family protein n=1 Tax=Polaromonas sp. TaxID=1869339 RepID=UPI002737266E|nr:enoyl-CoA hydratase/isomerase family protein [Polaromonas sp.]MDP3795765.1 enoyl-CoA hydratase/isomerase family protein [Polaromonas sp.]
MTTKTSAYLEIRTDGPVASLVLNRPDKLNALTIPTLDALDQACGELERSRDIRVVILSSTNAKAFCAGADISEWGTLPPTDMWRLWTRVGHRIFDRLAQLPQPTIAAIDGLALGGGLELALACDLRVAGPASRFGLPETKIGAVPGWGGTIRLQGAVGVPQAKRLIFTGAQIDAAEALRIGLVQEVVASESAQTRVMELANEIAGNAPFAVRLTKQLLDAKTGGVPAETIAAGLAALLEDGQEGVRAFKEKRKPVFKDA